MRWRRKKTKDAQQAVNSSVAPSEKILVVPRRVLHTTHEHFVPYWEAGVETGCYWFGVDIGLWQVVTTLAVAKLFQGPGGFRVEPKSMRRLAKTMSEQRLENLAQIHTHPSDWVGHSAFDDAHAYSTRPGSLSIVWPNYGLALGHDLADIGVHEYDADGWRELNQDQIRRRLLVVDSVADCRWQIEGGFTAHVERDFQ